MNAILEILWYLIGVAFIARFAYILNSKSNKESDVFARLTGPFSGDPKSRLRKANLFFVFLPTLLLFSLILRVILK